MKTIIFFNANVNFKCDLNALKQPGTEYILLVTPGILPQISESNRFFFKTIHTLETMTDESAWPLVADYIQRVGKENVRFVSHDEHCLPIIARFEDRLNPSGQQEAKIIPFINKLIMKDILDKAGVRTPRHMAFDAQHFNDADFIEKIEKEIGYPFVVKPVALYGSASFKKILNREQWLAWGEKLKSSKISYEIEEFVNGTLFHCDSLVKDSKIIFTSISEYTWPLALFEHGYPLGSIWLPPKHPHWKRLAEFNEQVLTALKTPDGATHNEIFISDKNELIFLEVGARSPGANIVPIIEKVVGVNIELEHLKLRLKIPTHIQERPIQKYYLWSYIPKNIGKIRRLLTPSFKSDLHLEWLASAGQEIKLAPLKETDILFQYSKQAASVMMMNPNFAELYDDFAKLKTANFFEMET